jgi:hypothetical protein
MAEFWSSAYKSSIPSRGSANAGQRQSHGSFVPSFGLSAAERSSS